METHTVTIDTSRLMAAAEKAIKACDEFTKACEAFGSDPRDVVVGHEVVKGGLDLRGLHPLLCFQRALVSTVEQTAGRDVIHHGEWEDCNEMPSDVRTFLMSKPANHPIVVGKYIYRIAQ
jgi:hypothetical protein